MTRVGKGDICDEKLYRDEKKVDRMDRVHSDKLYDIFRMCLREYHE